MQPAPTKTPRPSSLATPQGLTVITNPVLEQIELELARQRRELDAAFSAAAELGGVSFVVDSELLEELDTACTSRPTSRGALITSTRC